MIRIDASKPYDDAVRHWVYGGRDSHRTLHGLWAMRSVQGPCRMVMYEVETALAQPCLAMGQRGLQRDVDVMRQLYTDGVAAVAPVLDEAERLVVEALPAWALRRRPKSARAFNLGSDAQLKAVLFGAKQTVPCPQCGDTGVVETRTAAVLPWYACPTCKPKKRQATDAPCSRCGGPTEPIVHLTGERRGQPATRAVRARTRLCGAKHVMPGLGIKGHRNRDTNGWMADRKTLGKILLRERGRGADVAIRLIELALQLSAMLKVPQEMLAKGRGADLHGPADAARMPFMLNVGLPGTHRFSSEPSPWGEGRNAQNLDHRARAAGVYVARPGTRPFSVDQDKAESHLLAAFAEDEAYLEAHEGPCDTHAMVANWIWPELDWPDDRREWKRFAEATPFTKVAGLPYSVPYDAIRQASKKTQHTIGRGGGGDIVATDLGAHRKFGDKLIDTFLDRTPGVRAFIDMLKTRLSQGDIVHVGVRAAPDVPLPSTVRGPAVVVHVGGGVYWWRQLLTDPASKDTYKDALAFILQSPSALISHIGALRLWRTADNRLLRPADGFQLLLNKHDALAGEATVDDAIGLTCRAMSMRMTICGRPLLIGVSGKEELV